MRGIAFLLFFVFVFFERAVWVSGKKDFRVIFELTVYIQKVRGFETLDTLKLLRMYILKPGASTPRSPRPYGQRAQRGLFEGSRPVVGKAVHKASLLLTLELRAVCSQAWAWDSGVS